MGIEGSLAARHLVFLHIPKTAGTTFDHVLETVSRLDGSRHYRAMGVVYGQYMGAEKLEAADAFRAADRRDLDECEFLSGHVPSTVWEERIDPEGCAFVTLLRDPVDRMISQYRFGIERGGWAADAKLTDLVAAGALVDNLQVRMLAGCEDPKIQCDQEMLQAALDRAERRFAVIGVSETFDAFLAALIQLRGWPEIIYTAYQVGQTRLDPRTLSAVQADAARFNQIDQALVADVRARGPVWINRIDSGPARDREDMILVVASKISGDSSAPPRIARSDLPNFAAALRRQGGELVAASSAF